MHFVDEEHIAVFQLGQYRGEITGSFQGGSGSDVQLCAHLVCHDRGHGGFAQPRWASQQQVISRFVSLTCRFQHDGKVLLEFSLPDEVGKSARTKFAVGTHIGVVASDGVDEFLTHDVPPTN